MTTADAGWRYQANCTPDVADAFIDVGIVAARKAVARFCWPCPVRVECRIDAYTQPAQRRIGMVAGGVWWDSRGNAKDLVNDPKLWTEGAAAA